jgi:nicotinamide mononucleotide transporter
LKISNGRVFLNAYKDVSLIHIVLEFIAFVFGILSVWYARSILVYPTGLIATVITCIFFFIAGYLGDMMINGYFTIMSIYGWYKWTRKVKVETAFNHKDEQQRKNNRDRIVFYYNFVVFSIYKIFDYQINVIITLTS